MANIRDVAKASKVSIATVSRVFNQSTLVSEATRGRVVAVASRLGYWPHGIARSLTTSRTHTLGVVMPDLFGEFFSEVVHGMDLAGREQGLHLLVTRSSSSADELTSALRSMRGRVDGLIVMAPDFDASPALQQSPGTVPTVLLVPAITPPGCDSVSIANADGAAMVVRHLIGLGHRTIAIIGGPERNIDAQQRRDGYRAALARARIPRSARFEYRGDFSEESGYEAARELLRGKLRPSAIFAANDYMAVGALGALHDAGVQVPEEVAVTGFDDIALARYLIPALTTVHVDMLELGRRAVGLLLDRGGREGGGAGRSEVLATSLVVRSSCGAASKSPGELRAAWNGERPSRPRRR